jgi:hypothetical protein
MDLCKLCSVINSIPWTWARNIVCVIITILVILGIVWIASKWESIANLFN